MPIINRTAEAKLPTHHGDFSMYVYLEDKTNKEHIALVAGDVTNKESVLVRIHSECITGDVFSSQRCDCGEQLNMSLHMIAQQEAGILLYLRQEGRGIGLINKIKSYALQETGIDTMTANRKLGFPADMRDYSPAISMLKDLQVQSIRLLTNNPDKINTFVNSEIPCVERVPVEALPNEHNHYYLKTKRDAAGHLLLQV